MLPQVSAGSGSRTPLPAMRRACRRRSVSIRPVRWLLSGPSLRPYLPSIASTRLKNGLIGDTPHSDPQSDHNRCNSSSLVSDASRCARYAFRSAEPVSSN